MPSHYTSKTASFTDAADIHILLISKDVDQNLVTDFDYAVILLCGFFPLFNVGGRFGRSSNCNFLQKFHGWNIVLGKMSGHRLADTRSLYKFNQTDLDGIIAILLRRLSLRHHTRTGLQDRDRANFAVLV